MTVEYSIESARTANFPPLFVFHSPDTQLLFVEPEEEITRRGLRVVDPSTGVEVAPLRPPQGISAAVLNVNRYQQPGTFATAASFKLTHDPWHVKPAFAQGTVQLTYRTPRTSPHVTVIRPKTRVEGETPASTGRPVTEALALLLDAWAIKRAKESLRRAREAATAGDLRSAYRNVYHGLDELFRRGKWEAVSTELAELCSPKYPATFGIGAMRFSSDAARHIRGWAANLSTLAKTADTQGIDVARAMRGLSQNNGNP